RAAVAFDTPPRQRLVPRLVPPADLPGALALNLTMFQAATIAGPGLAGLLIAGASPAPGHAGMPAGASTSSLGLLYVLNALSFLFVLGALAAMRADGRAETGETPHEAPLAALPPGLGFSSPPPFMVWRVGLVFVAPFFSGAVSPPPMGAARVPHAAPRGSGPPPPPPAVGALLGSAYTSVFPLP